MLEDLTLRELARLGVENGVRFHFEARPIFTTPWCLVNVPTNTGYVRQWIREHVGGRWWGPIVDEVVLQVSYGTTNPARRPGTRS